MQETETPKQDGRWYRRFNWARLQIRAQRHGVHWWKSLKKNRRKGVQKNKLFDTACEKNINTVAEKPVSSENRYISRWYYCCRYVDGGWSIPSSFQKIIKQLEVIQEVLQKHLRQLT